MTLQVIALLVLVNAFYVAAEFSFVAVRRGQIRLLAEEGNRFARSVLGMIEKPAELDRAIAACQIGITLSSLILGAYGQATLSPALAPMIGRWFDWDPDTAFSLAATLVLVVLTGFQVVLGELLPKSLALQHPVKTAMYCVLPLRWSLTFYSWFIWLLNGSGLLLLKLLGVRQTDVRHVHSAKEIELLLAESRKEGLIEAEEHVRFRRALRLGMRSARQLMIPLEEVVAVDVDAPIALVLSVAARSPYTRLPVYQGTKERYIGMIHVKDLVVHQLEQGEVRSIRPVLRQVVRVSERMEADELLAVLRERRSQLALVQDHEQHVVGLISLEDVLAEVLGDIGDEFKGSIEGVPEVTADGRVRIPGTYPLEEAESWIGVPWHSDSKTVGAFVGQYVEGRLAPGQRVKIDGVDVEIERVTRQRITSVLASPMKETAGG